MTKVETSPLSHLTFRQTLSRVLVEPINDLYATNASAPLQKKAGIRQVYKYGLYSYCGYFGDSGTCSKSTMGNKYLPYNDILADMSSNYSALSASIISGKSSFTSLSIGGHTHSASYLILIGTICAFLTFVM
jgi:1,3-beta-glucanosyltransferase GAS1